MKCYYPIDSAGNRIGFKTPEACVYDASGTSLTTKLAQINSNISANKDLINSSSLVQLRKASTYTIVLSTKATVKEISYDFWGSYVKYNKIFMGSFGISFPNHVDGADLSAGKVLPLFKFQDKINSIHTSLIFYHNTTTVATSTVRGNVDVDDDKVTMYFWTIDDVGGDNGGNYNVLFYGDFA